MTSFGYWQDMAAEADRFLCMICFEGFPLVDAYVDESGDAWDICDECGLDEEFYKEYVNDCVKEEGGR